ncbi:MAG: endonuclease [Alicyclobacillus herbarius]|uniref:endonuclease III domain-containing protein n=1 Tax=Alicyclobacillus herbarius TaxID=122960 RepID=UPI002353704C|nr:endonuclease [Alicyclobacillus herbarius]MCL6631222.1 endonuclease [Alicyclobacillus herbarius]
MNGKSHSNSFPASPDKRTREHMLQIYTRLFQHFGDRKWWPAKTREEIVIGAILVQNVSWANTVKAIDALENHGLLSFQAIESADLDVLESCLIPTRFYRVKAKKLKAFSKHLKSNYRFDLDRMLALPTEELRAELLSIYGIGPETADDIVLYAAAKPTFVIDAYTRRIFHRLGMSPENPGYEVMRNWFLNHLPEDVVLFNQYHALLDALGNQLCRQTKPRCPNCPLLDLCRYGQQQVNSI